MAHSEGALAAVNHYKNSLPPEPEPLDMLTFNNGLAAGTFVNLVIRCYFKHENESGQECFLKAIDRNAINNIVLKTLNLKPMLELGLPFSTASKLVIDSCYNKAAFNIHYGLELAKYTIVSFASFLIPAKLFSNEIITNQFSLGFMINTFPIALEPAVDSLTEYALNGICSVTGHCLANAMIE